MPMDFVLRWQRIASQAMRYGLVGGACAVINIAIVYVGHDLLGVHYVVAALLTCAVTIPLGYMLHARLTFATGRAAGWPEFGRFLTVQLAQFALGLGLMALLVELLMLTPVVAMIAVSFLLYLYGFVASARWVYRVFAQSSRNDVRAQR